MGTLMDKKAILSCLKALGDESRVRMVMLLREKELCVCQIKEVLGISQPLASRHLSILKNAGLVESRREGKLMYYRLSEQARTGGKLGLVQVLNGALKSDSVVRDDRARLRECHPPHGQSHKKARRGPKGG